MCALSHYPNLLSGNSLTTLSISYIKEFVHGDFGRTQPNLGTLMRTNADILQLDVEVCKMGHSLWNNPFPPSHFQRYVTKNQ